MTEVELVTRLADSEVKKFKLEDMVFQGHLEL